METQQPGCIAEQTLQQETRVNIHSFIKHLVSRPYPEDDCIGGGDGQVDPTYTSGWSTSAGRKPRVPWDHTERHPAWMWGAVRESFLEEMVTEPGPENKWELAK